MTTVKQPQGLRCPNCGNYGTWNIVDQDYTCVACARHFGGTAPVAAPIEATLATNGSKEAPAAVHATSS